MPVTVYGVFNIREQPPGNGRDEEFVYRLCGNHAAIIPQ
jgi:hypothetical protein